MASVAAELLANKSLNGMRIYVSSSSRASSTQMPASMPIGKT
jgi:hypothetical protein